jgi:hypothetical protein
MKNIMRLVLSVGAMAAAVCLYFPASRASETYPWCAVLMFGAGDVYWDCHYHSVEECRPNVIAGNRGFCNLNPWYAPMTIKPTKHRKRHVPQN